MGQKLLLKEGNLQIHPGQHIGISGANGSGKTSLLRLVAGELQVDEGEVIVPESTTLAYMVQEMEATDRRALDFVIDGDVESRRLQAELADAENRKDSRRISDLHEKLEISGAYSVGLEAEKILHGLGFVQDDLGRPVQAFSGGWRIRLKLARVLLSPGDILLLDEPTNHLDLDATLWLEKWLRQYPGSLLLISHDRDFLDRTVQYMLLLENQALRLYQGNYSAFEKQRMENLAQQQSMYEKQEKRKKQIQAFVNRFRAKASKARQAQSRLRELERMGAIAAAHVDSPFSFQIPCAQKISDPLITMKDADLGYDDRAVLAELCFSIHPGDKVGILGKNGAGKTTLIRAIDGALELQRGERILGQHLRTGYFAQHQLEALDVAASSLLHLQRLKMDATEQVIRNFLGGFGFHGDRVLEEIINFSGGEKARLALAIIAWQEPNLLILDEPTNHLDIEMRQALAFALQEYEGALIMISHDRHLLRNCVNAFWLVEDGRLREYDGDLEDYQAYREKDSVEENHENDKNSRQSARQLRQQMAARREALRPLKKKLDKLESEINTDQQALVRIEWKLADAAMYTAENRDELQDVLRQQGRLKQQLKANEAQWLACQEELELLERH